MTQHIHYHHMHMLVHKYNSFPEKTGAGSIKNKSNLKEKTAFPNKNVEYY